MSHRPTLIALVLAAASGAALVAFARPAPEARPVAGWEYLVVRGAGIDLGAPPKAQDEQMAAAQGTLNSLGAEGWELSAIQGQFAVLRRGR
jgi:hypothetical protein